ncbi:MAG: helix-turn-helix transcriptional regulator [Balneolaceae bacterium]
MLYDRIIPPSSLSTIIDCYWVVENEDQSIKQQKIIPDGFPELIFHYGNPYRINISGSWETQTPMLLAGQIYNHFLLENTGTSGMIGIKFKPATLTLFFGIDMKSITDKVVDLNSILSSERIPISDQLVTKLPYQQKINLLNSFFDQVTFEKTDNDALILEAISMIFDSNGIITISELTENLNVNERKLERLFDKYVGLSPKFYSRIIRFNYIFALVQNKKMKWSEAAHLSGFYDQSHFINNFQEFTGEDPSKYFFEDENMANFFLKRTTGN